jgi:hypothetical protein
MLPNFVIIGAQKSASSFLQACLAEHPDIYIPHEEIPFFESPDYEEHTINDLRRILEGRQEKCLGIKRPNYIGKSEVPSRLEYHLPNAKLIAVLRNPIERAISAYFHQIRSGTIPPFKFESGIKKILQDKYFNNQYKRAHEIIEFGLYYKYLSQYSHFLKNNQLLIFLHEDIKREPLKSVKKAYNFLDISADYIPKSLASQPQMVLYNLTRLRFLTLRN